MGAVEYEVLAGQDPVVVSTALREAGYRVAPNDAPASNVLTIEWNDEDGSHGRADARSIIAGVRTTVVGGPANVDPDPVRFADES